MAPGPPQGKLGGPPQQTATKTPLPPTPNQALVQNTELTVRTRPRLVVPVRTQQAEGGPARAHRQRPSQRDQGDTNKPPPPELPQHLGNVHLGPGVPQHSTTQRSSTEDRTPPLSGCSNPTAAEPSHLANQKHKHAFTDKKGQAEHKSRHRAKNPPPAYWEPPPPPPNTTPQTVFDPKVDPFRARTTEQSQRAARKT